MFVFSGNGSQWSGMGRAAYRANAAFREALAEVDSHFLPLAGWSLIEELDSPDLASDLTHADVAQPMIFAIQAASVRALAEVGIRPALTLGHSVGEVAAAEAAGVLSLSDATRVIFHRSRLQQATLNAGAMAVVFGPRQAAADLVDRIPGLVVAAHNSHRCVAVAGPQAALDRLFDLAPSAKLKARPLDLPYPFHTELMEPVKTPLIESLKGLKPAAGSIPFSPPSPRRSFPGRRSAPPIGGAMFGRWSGFRRASSARWTWAGARSWRSGRNRRSKPTCATSPSISTHTPSSIACWRKAQAEATRSRLRLRG